MDIALSFCDDYFFDPYVYPTSWPRNNFLRQFLSLNVICDVGGALLYLITASLSWFLIFDKRLLKHKLALKNQVSREIKYTLGSIPFMGILTAFCFLLEINDYGRLYDDIEDRGWIFLLLSVASFIMFTDFMIYWIHRWLHIPFFYRHLHKAHHAWKVPTPFASHAFHPLDGFAQSIPYHVYVFLFPMHKITYILLYIFVNIWTVSIHDGDFRVPKFLQPLVNGSAHHMDHHVYYNYNYGQYTTLWDRLGGSFKEPSAYLGDGPLDQVKRNVNVKSK